MSISKFRSLLDRTEVSDLMPARSGASRDDLKAKFDELVDRTVEAELKRRMPMMSEHLATQAKVLSNVDALGEHEKTKGLLESERQARAAAEAGLKEERARADGATKREAETAQAKAEIEGRMKAIAEASVVFAQTVKDEIAGLHKRLDAMTAARAAQPSAPMTPREKRPPPNYEVRFKYDSADRMLGADLIPK